jgi:hypothetical protein
MGFFSCEKKSNKCLQILRVYGFEARFNTSHWQEHFLLAVFSRRQQTESDLDVDRMFSYGGGLWNEGS